MSLRAVVIFGLALFGGLIAGSAKADCLNTKLWIVLQSQPAPVGDKWTMVAYVPKPSPPRATRHSYFAVFDRHCTRIVARQFDGYNSAAFQFRDLPFIGKTVIVRAEWDGCPGPGRRSALIVFGIEPTHLRALTRTVIEGDSLRFAQEGSQRADEIVSTTMVWAPGEDHFGSHRYHFALYRWNGHRFGEARKMVTRQKYEFDRDSNKSSPEEEFNLAFIPDQDWTFRYPDIEASDACGG